MRTPGNLARLQGVQALGQIAPAQHRTGARPQFSDPKLLGPLMGHVVILPAAAVASSLAQERPAAGLIRGAAEQLPIDKALGHQHLMAVGLLPVGREPRQAELHGPAGQIRHMRVGQDQKAAVVDHQRQTAGLLSGAPANPSLPVFEIKRGGVPRQQRHPLILIFDHIAQLLAD